MSSTNGLQGQSGFAGAQMNNVNGINPATPVQNIYSPAMGQPITYGNAQTQQSPHHVQPHFVGQQQAVNFNSSPYTLPMRNPSGTTMNFAAGNIQLAQQVPRSQPGFVNPQMINANGWNPEMAIGNHPYTMDVINQLNTSTGQQPGQFQINQNDQHAPIYQNTEEYQYGQNYQLARNYQPTQNYQPVQNHRNFSVNQSYAPNPTGNRHQARARFLPQAGNPAQAINPPQAGTSSQAGNPTQFRNTHNAGNPLRAGTPTRATNTSQASNPPRAGSAVPIQPSSVPEISEEFQEHVKNLVKEKATTFEAHIKNRNQFDRYEQAVWKAKLSGGNHENKSGDYPQDEAGELRIIERIFNAIVNIDGEQDPATDNGDFANCLAVKIIQGLSTIDVELLAHKLMVSTAASSVVENSRPKLTVNTERHAQDPVRRACA